jgi:hypothetical protein
MNFLHLSSCSLVGSSYQCICQSGYTGERCQELLGGELLNEIRNKFEYKSK